MRDAFVAELYNLAKADPNIILLSGDIGFGVFDKFRADFPRQFINMGIAEANMIGVSAGLALNGKKPFVYTIAPFAVMRPFEQIRVDLCMQNLPVTIIGVGGGLSYGTLGPTHHSIEDVAIMRSLPNMAVMAPADPTGVKIATYQAAKSTGPTYIRLGKNGEPNLIFPSKSQVDVTIIGYGPILLSALKASSLLEQHDISCRVFNVLTIKPLNIQSIYKVAHTARAIVTLEEHSIIGGIGSAVAEILAEGSFGIPFCRMGIRDSFVTTVGSQNYLLKELKLSPEDIVETVLAMWAKS